MSDFSDPDFEDGWGQSTRNNVPIDAYLARQQATQATPRERIENLWSRATPIGPLLDAYRAAVLREAADALDNSKTLRDLTDDHMHDVNAAANELRWMAEEAGR